MRHYRSYQIFFICVTLTVTFDLYIWKVATEKNTISQIGQLLAQGYYYDYTPKN